MEGNFYFVKDPFFNKCFTDAYNAITILDFWEILKKPILSFTSYYNFEFNQLERLADKDGIHNGSSYGFTMRNMELIAKYGWDYWKLKYIKDNRPDMIVAAKHITNILYFVLSSPFYKKGRCRILGMLKK